MIEGTTFPFFGTLSRLDYPAFVFGKNRDDKIDHSAKSRNHSQLISNFFVDECKMSGNTFKDLFEANSLLIENTEAITIETTNGIRSVYAF